MLAPVVLIVFAVYWVIAWPYLRWARSRGKRYALLWTCIFCMLLLFGDHAVGYLYFKWYTSFISVPGPVSLVTSDMSVENYAQDEEQRKAEGSGVGGKPPIFDAWNASRYLWTPVRYSSSRGTGLGDITTGLSRLEIVDLRHSQLHPTELPVIRKYSIVKRPDERCQDFEAQSNELRKAQHRRMATYGLLEAERYCIANEVTHSVKSRYTEKQISTDYHHPRVGILAALGGTYFSRFQIIDNQTGQVVFEGKSATFYGGWVWQFARFWPDMNYEVAQAQIITQGLPAQCCRSTHIPGLSLLPYEVSP